tara:strand:+ start:1508 stop:2089 length:582 start_codon:yes stop_codon:yes gene_type:complete
LKKKIFIQVLLFILILLICFFSYNKYFAKKNVIKNNDNQKESTTNDSSNNLIKNLRYDVKFDNNSRYIITSDLSEITYLDGEEIVLMKVVKATFQDEKGSILKIIADQALYNNSNYNTNFEKNVNISYLNEQIKSQKLFLNFDENIVTISDNIIYEGMQGLMKTDNIEINLVTKNIEIFMNDSQDKVEITSKK